MMKHLFYRPGKERKQFSYYRKQAVADEKGRVAYGDSIYLGQFWGSLSSSTQKEYDRFGQKESGRRSAVQHTTSHIIITWGKNEVMPGDILFLGDGLSGLRKFYVQAVEDPGELHLMKRIYCEERFGSRKEVMASV